MKYETKCTVHLCDGCGQHYYQFFGAGLPGGYYLDVTSVNDHRAQHAEIFVCGEDCVLPAFEKTNHQWTRAEQHQ